MEPSVTWRSGTAGRGDAFGSDLAVGRYAGGRRYALAVGVPLEILGTKSRAGRVVVMYGSSGGLIDTGSQSWHHESRGIPVPPKQTTVSAVSIGEGSDQRPQVLHRCRSRITTSNHYVSGEAGYKGVHWQALPSTHVARRRVTPRW